MNLFLRICLVQVVYLSTAAPDDNIQVPAGTDVEVPADTEGSVSGSGAIKVDRRPPLPGDRTGKLRSYLERYVDAFDGWRRQRRLTLAAGVKLETGIEPGGLERNFWYLDYADPSIDQRLRCFAEDNWVQGAPEQPLWECELRTGDLRLRRKGLFAHGSFLRESLLDDNGAVVDNPKADGIKIQVPYLSPSVKASLDAFHYFRPSNHEESLARFIEHPDLIRATFADDETGDIICVYERTFAAVHQVRLSRATVRLAKRFRHRPSRTLVENFGAEGNALFSGEISTAWGLFGEHYLPTAQSGVQRINAKHQTLFDVRFRYFSGPGLADIDPIAVSDRPWHKVFGSLLDPFDPATFVP